MSLSLPHYPSRITPLLTTISGESLGHLLRMSGPANHVSTAWGTANQARYIPFVIPEPITVVKLLAYNGATVNGTTDIGLYDASGNAVISIAKATQAGTSAWQEFDVTDTTIDRALYYIGLLNSGTTGTYMCFGDRNTGRAAGVFSQAVGSADLPSPATFAALDSGIIPIVGMSIRTLI